MLSCLASGRPIDELIDPVPDRFEVHEVGSNGMTRFAKTPARARPIQVIQCRKS